jgi:hypothetical protein
MKTWHFFAGAFFLWLFFGGDSGTISPRPRSTSGGSYTLPNTPPATYWGAPVGSVGNLDCTVFNLTTGHGPYALMCEREGDEIRINFPNGGHIIVDEDGYHARTGNLWEVELEE